MLKTNTERRDRIKWLRNRLDTLLENDTVRLYLKWKALPDEEKTALAKRWKEYYQECAKSEMAQLSWEIHNGFKERKLGATKKLARKATEWRINGKRIPQPSTVDPQTFMYEHRCGDYDRAIEELEKLQQITKLEPEDIFT